MGIIFNNFYLSSFIEPDILARYIVTIFFTLINLLITYIILKKLLFNPTMKFLDKRKQSIEDEIDKGKKTKQLADEKFSEAIERVDNSIHEATTILNDAKTQANVQSQIVIDDAKKEAENIIDHAKRDTERLKKVMIEQMRDEVSDLSVKIASKVVKHSMSEKEQRKLIDSFLVSELKGDGE